jgi:pimeloyl-ACP methyl ester carboxylesterase
MAQRASRHVFVSGGLKLVADVGGPADAPTVVLLHGGGQTRHSWSGAMAALMDNGYRVINFDARGHGDSDWSPDGGYDLKDRAADLRSVLSGSGVPFALVGASLGGATSITAVAEGLRPVALVVVDIVPHPGAEGIARIVQFMRSHADGFATLEEAAMAVAAYNPSRARPKDASGLMRNLRLDERQRLRWHWDPRIVGDDPQIHHAAVQRSCEALGLMPDLPVLLVRGMESDVVTDDGVEAFRRLLPWLEIADVAGAGHMVAGDRNDAFNASVLAFLARSMPSRASGS